MLISKEAIVYYDNYKTRYQKLVTWPVGSMFINYTIKNGYIHVNDRNHNCIFIRPRECFKSN